jgi:hypothetical protein
MAIKSMFYFLFGSFIGDYFLFMKLTILGCRRYGKETRNGLEREQAEPKMGFVEGFG